MLPAALTLPERQWWPRSSKNSSSNPSFKPHKDLSRSTPNSSKKSGMKFSTLTNAIGFKSKKNHIQEPPSKRNAPGIDIPTVRYANRPPAKSVSSTLRSWDDSSEPQTPSDVARSNTRSRPSVPTESDPFSPDGVRFQPVIYDPTRLSAYSGSSDLGKKNDIISFNRSSYASSSSYQGADMSPNSSAISLSGSTDASSVSPTKRSDTRRKKESLVPPHRDENVVDLGDLDEDAYTPYSSLFKSSSSSTLTEKNKPSESQVSRLRPRGMTDGGSTWSPQSIPDFLRNTSSVPKTPSLTSTSPNLSTHVLVRQSSASRVAPPTAPPSRELPAPPSKNKPRLDNESTMSSGSSSSSLSFASGAHSNRDPMNHNVSRNMEWDKESITSKLSTTRTVKKAISHQSFSKRVPNLSSTSGPSTPSDDMVDRVPRKQRSFHHTSRSIVPSLPMPPRNPPPIPARPHTAQPSSSSDAQPGVEQRKVSATSGRKRLFSGGSTKLPPPQIFSADDDIFTSEGGPTQPTGGTFLTPERTDSPAPSVGNDDAPGSPVTSTEYTPQMIMSPAEMLRLEASFNEGSEDDDFGSPRRRVQSSASISPSVSYRTEGLRSPSIPKHYVVDRASKLPCRTYQDRGDSGMSSPLHKHHLQSTTQTSVSQNDSCSPTLSPPLGLPPPPRPRRQTGNSPPETPLFSLSPPPIRRQNSRASPHSQPVRSIMKKPSFLDIEDDGHARSIPVPSKFAGSFLDLERGKDSFDTIRSEDEDLE